MDQIIPLQDYHYHSSGMQRIQSISAQQINLTDILDEIDSTYKISKKFTLNRLNQTKENLVYRKPNKGSVFQFDSNIYIGKIVAASTQKSLQPISTKDRISQVFLPLVCFLKTEISKIYSIPFSETGKVMLKQMTINTKIDSRYIL